MKATAETHALFYGAPKESQEKFISVFANAVNHEDYESIMNSMSKDELRTLIEICESLETNAKETA